MTSIRRTLTTRVLVSLAVLGITCGGLLYAGVRAALIRQFDQTLMARLATMQSATRWDGEGIDVDFTDEAMPWYRAGANAEYFEIRPAAAATLPGLPFRSPSLMSRPFGVSPVAGAAIMDHTLPDGRAGRVAAIQFRPLPEESLDEPGREALRREAELTSPTLVLAVGMERGSLDATLRIIAAGVAAAGLVVVIGAIIAVIVSIRRGLAPLEALGASVAAIRADSLSTRLDHRSLPAELEPIQRRLNDLLERLALAFEREQRFTGAAAHELRTPVAELRSLLEVSLSRPRSAEERGSALQESLEITLRIQRLVQTLLRVARSRGAAPPELSAVAVTAVLSEVVARHAAAAQARGGRIELDAGFRGAALADPAALGAALENLIANAVEYSSPAPIIACRVVDAGSRVVIEIRNPATRLTAQDLDRFFEPFWRRDAARSTSEHLGMGLTFTRALVEEMRGELSLSFVDGQVEARLSLQAAPWRPGSGASRPDRVPHAGVGERRP